MIDWERLPEAIAIAVGLWVVIGPVGAAAVEMIKRIIATVCKWNMPAEIATTLSAIIASGLVAYAMIEMKHPIIIAILAAIAAVFAPKVVHDTYQAKVLEYKSRKNGDS